MHVPENGMEPSLGVGVEPSLGMDSPDEAGGRRRWGSMQME